MRMITLPRSLLFNIYDLSEEYEHSPSVKTGIRSGILTVRHVIEPLFGFKDEERLNTLLEKLFPKRFQT
jgi:hypothetical protein